MKTYTISWKDYKGQDCLLTIYDTESTGEDVVVWTPSTRPFITNEDSDTNPFVPVRTSTAKISILTKSLPAIELTSSHRHRVIMKVAGAVKWLGWLSADVMNQGFNYQMEEFTLNAICDLGAMATWQLDPKKGFEIVTLRSLIKECFDHVDGIIGEDMHEDTYYPRFQVMPIFNDETTALLNDIFEYKISRYNFFKENKDNEAEPYKCDTCLDVLSKICLFFGFSLRIVGTKVYFSHFQEGVYYRFPSLRAFFVGSMSSRNDASVTPTTMPTPVADDHQISVEQGKGTISIVANVNDVPRNVVPSLNFDKADVKWVSELMNITYGNPQQPDGSTYDWRWKVRYLVPTSKNLKLHHYVSTQTSAGPTTPVVESQIGEYGDVSLRNNQIGSHTYAFDYIGGAHVISHDGWDARETEGKINFDFKTRLILTSMMPTPFGLAHRTNDYMAVSKPLLEANGDEVAIYTSGGFEIAFSAHCPKIYNLNIWSAISGMGVIQNISGPYLGGDDGPTQIGQYDETVLQCMFCVGDWYWNGNSWSSTPSTFNIDCNLQEVEHMAEPKTNKTLDMDFYATKYVMPINSPIQGRIRFAIIGTLSRRNGGNNLYERDIVFVEGLSVKYCPPLTNINTTDERKAQHTYTRQTEGFTDKMADVNLDINSNNDDPANYSQLIDVYGNNVEELDYTYTSAEGKQRPEQRLADVYKTIFGRPSTILEIDADDDGADTPMNWMQYSDKRIKAIAVSEHDYTTNKKRIIYRQQ